MGRMPTLINKTALSVAIIDLIISLTITISIVFWTVIAVLWILEYNDMIPPGTSANLADYYPFIGSNAWPNPSKNT